MKKLLAILCLLCVSVSTFAFAEENTIVFGGTVDQPISSPMLRLSAVPRFT